MDIFTDKSLSPNLQKYLQVIPQELLHHSSYSMKHPSAIYNVSLMKIDVALKDFMEVFSMYDSSDFEEVDKKNTTKLLQNYKTLLYAFREYLDDCYSILKTFIEPPQNEKKNRVQYKWLEINAKPEIDDFLQANLEYKKYLDGIVNELKHNNSILCAITFYDKDTPSDNCMGYFVANVFDGTYAPVQAIHPKIGDMYTGFSFRRDLHYNLFNIFKTAEDILDFLINKKNLQVNALSHKINESPETKIDLYKKVMNISRYHFPDEYNKPIPSLAITKDGLMKLSYPSQLSIRPNRLNRVVLTHSTDGHTAGYAVPYM